MTNLKKIDDHDFVFVNKSLSEKEEKAFSEFLKARKSKLKTKQRLQPKSKTKKTLAQ